MRFPMAPTSCRSIPRWLGLSTGWFTWCFVGLLAVVNVSCASTTRGLRIEHRNTHPARQQALERMRRERRVALVIGNGAYVGVGSLKNPPNDADLMARTLTSLGFSVTLVKDADGQRMNQVVRAFEQELSGADVGLFYFAGHGVQRDGHNYLIPTAPAIASAGDFDDHALSLSALMDAMRRAGPRMNIVILDACRNDPFPRSTRGGWGGLAEPEDAGGTVTAYSAAKGRVAIDGEGDNSPYTKALTVQMRKPNIEIGTMLRNVFAAVDEETGGAQQPWYEVAVKGQFFFNLTEEPPADLDPNLLARGSGIPALAIGGASVAGFGAALLFGAMAFDRDHELAQACGDRDTCPTRYRHLEEDRNLYRTLGWVGAGVGTLALAGLFWLLLDDSHDQARGSVALRWSVDRARGAFAGIGGEF